MICVGDRGSAVSIESDGTILKAPNGITPQYAPKGPLSPFMSFIVILFFIYNLELIALQKGGAPVNGEKCDIASWGSSMFLFTTGTKLTDVLYSFLLLIIIVIFNFPIY